MVSIIYGLVRVCQWPLLPRELEFWELYPSSFLVHQAGLCRDHGGDLRLRELEGGFR